MCSRYEFGPEVMDVIVETTARLGWDAPAVSLWVTTALLVLTKEDESRGIGQVRSVLRLS